MVATTANNQAATTVTLGGSLINGSAAAVFLWCSTARDRPGTSSDQQSDAYRTAQRCFMRGLKERISINTNSGASWKWRRICFAMKTRTSLEPDAPTSLLTNNGWVRLLNRIEGSATWGNIQSILFKGSAATDWLDTFDAPIDTARVDLKFDKRRVLNSGNQNGKFFTAKYWHAMNKDIVYDDDEIGQAESVGTRSVTDKQGMGDYYVMDIFECATQSASDSLIFTPEATLYWHEK